MRHQPEMDVKRGAQGLGLALVTALLLGGCVEGAADGGADDSGSNNHSGYYADGGYGGDGWAPPSNSNGPEPNPITFPEQTQPDFCADATDMAVTLYMSADDSGSQAQPVYARWMVAQGQASTIKNTPPREYEYLNYYTFDYPAAPAGELAIVPELRYHADLDEYSLLVGVVAPAVALNARRSWNLVFSVDTSGSMSESPLANAKHVMSALAAQMQAGDIVSIVSWSSSQSVVLQAHPVSGANDPTLLTAIAGLSANGSTDLHGGLVRAYELANQNYTSSRLNRVILISDGGANTGITDEDLIGSEASGADGDGIFLVGVGTSDSYNHTLMDTVTDAGRGAYMYVPNQAEANKVFGPDRVLSNVEIAAQNVRLELTLPPQFVIQKFHGEQISTEPSEVREQHLAPNDQMLYHSTFIYCGDGDPQAESLAFRVTWTDPLTKADLDTQITIPVSDLLLAKAAHLEKAELLVDYARLLVNADVLDASDWTSSKQNLLNQIQTYSAATADPEMPEISTTLAACAY